jgi:hypothetical protein
VTPVILSLRAEGDHHSDELWTGPITLPVYMPVPRLGEILELGNELTEFTVTEVFHRYTQAEGPVVAVTAVTRLEGFTPQDVIEILQESVLCHPSQNPAKG